MNTNKNSTIAKRYAKSLFDLAKDSELSMDNMLNDLNNTQTILKNSPDLYNAMTNPIISAKNKEEIIDAVFNRDVNEIIRNTLKLLIKKNRFNLIFSIVSVFKNLIDELNNTLNVDVKCAIELNDENKTKIQKTLTEKLNKNIKINYTIDESIIAGLIYKIEDDVIDTSIQHKIEELKKEIIK